MIYSLDNFRECIAERSDSGMLIAADWCELDSDDASTALLGRLMRSYVNVQTYVRMSLPIPLEIAAEFDELSKSFDMPQRRDLEEYGCYYERPLGPLYTSLTVTQARLIADTDMLSREPVRDLTITRAQPGADLAMILRNYRMGYMERLTIRFQRTITNTAELYQNIAEQKLYAL